MVRKILLLLTLTEKRNMGGDSKICAKAES